MAEPTSNDGARALLHLSRGAGSRVGAERIALLEAVAAHRSIAGAAKAAGLSYKGAWDAVQALNNLFEQPLVETQAGGRTGGEAMVTAAGLTVIAAFHRLEAAMATVVGQLEDQLGGADPLAGVAGVWGMRTSARNTFGGVVSALINGAVNAEVILRVSDAVEIVATVTRESVETLGLEVGARAMALIKSSFVILVPGDAPLRTSARNRFTGTVLRHTEGAVNDEVVLDLGHGKTLTATITRESGEALAFAVGDRAQALVKASHVILAVD